MTLYAPHTSGQACSLIARRLLLGRPAVMAVCFTAFVSSVVTSSHSNYDRSENGTLSNGVEEKVVSHSLLPIPVQGPGYLSKPEALTITTAGIAPAILDSDAMIRAVIESEHPQFDPRPLPDRAPDDLYGKDGAPDAPDPTVRLASLALPDATHRISATQFAPRLPDTASLAIIPPDLNQSRQWDAPAIIDTDGGRPQIDPENSHEIESINAIGGETLEHLLEEFSINEDDRRATLVALRADDIAETLSTDDRIDLAFRHNRKLGTNKLVGIRLRVASPGQEDHREVELRWDGKMHDLWDAPATDGQDAELAAYSPITTSEALTGHALGITEPERVFLQGIVHTSLYQAADEAGMTPGEATTLTDIFRYLIDFERDLRRGDRFEVLFDKKENGDYGDIAYAMIENQGRQIALYRAENSNSEFEYFDAEGKTNRRALMRTPLAYSRISSRYGMRRHPIDGYRKMHRGVDFSAPRGTPIVAAGNGVVEYAGRRGGYGKYVRIRHNRTYKTAYAHLSRYATALEPGKRVKQGDVIGYVGSTGRSTGPHLHFEVLKNNEQVNPIEVGDFGPIRSLAAADLARFKAGIARINLVLGELRNKAVIASIEQ